MSRMIPGFIMVCKNPRATLVTLTLSSSLSKNKMVSNMGCITSKNREIENVFELVDNWEFEATICWNRACIFATESPL